MIKIQGKLETKEKISESLVMRKYVFFSVFDLQLAQLNVPHSRLILHS